MNTTRSFRLLFVVCGFLPTAICLLPTCASAQNMQVQNAYMYLGEKKYDKAKASADAAVEYETTKGVPKAWLYRGQIYQAIFQDTSRKVNQLDPDAQEKSVESYIKCLQLAKDNKVYKDEVKGGLAVSAASLLNKTENYYLPSKQFDKATAACELLKITIPYDSDELLKRRNVTAENVMYVQYRTCYASKELNKAKELGNKLMEINFKIPAIYSSMTKLSLEQKDTVFALSCLDKGLALFDDNIDLITLQIDVLMMQKKNDLLKQKLESAVETNPDSDVLHSALANLYSKLNDTEKAEKEYMKAIELNPKNEYAQFNLGALYFNTGNEWNKKSNDLPPKEAAKAKDYDAKTDAYFRKAIVYFEQYYQLKQDAAVKQRLRQLYSRLGETEKAEKYK